MTDLTPNIPEVVAEVSAMFERYEQALIDKNVEALDATFWKSPHTIRLANYEHGYGFDRIHAHRVARPIFSLRASTSPRSMRSRRGVRRERRPPR